MAGMLDGRTAIVTGAASGVGRAVAERFLEEGASVMMTDADEAKLAEEAERLGEGDAPVAHWCCDLREKLGVANLLASVADRFGPPDILVNAALKPVGGDVLDAAQEALDAAYEANIRSVFMLSQAVARRMIEAREAQPERPGGAIVTMTSVVGARTVPGLLPFSVTCAALDQLTRAMAVALAPRGIRVNGVALGPVMTPALRDALRATDGLRAAILTATPLGRIGEADEAAAAAVFLASAAGSFVTGQILAVDGGWTVLDPLAAPTA